MIHQKQQTSTKHKKHCSVRSLCASCRGLVIPSASASGLLHWQQTQALRSLYTNVPCHYKGSIVCSVAAILGSDIGQRPCIMCLGSIYFNLLLVQWMRMNTSTTQPDTIISPPQPRAPHNTHITPASRSKLSINHTVTVLINLRVRSILGACQDAPVTPGELKSASEYRSQTLPVTKTSRFL